MAPREPNSAAALSPTPTPSHPMAIHSVLNPEDDHQSQYGARTASMSMSPSVQSRDYSRSPDPSSASPPIETQRTTEVQRSSMGGGSYPSNRERREFRPTYQQEEQLFLWYHRIDLGMDWTDVRNAYNAQFPQRQRRGFQGMQCKYYRCCESHGVPRVRNRDRTASMGKAYGLRARLPSVWYPWMRTEPLSNGQR